MITLSSELIEPLVEPTPESVIAALHKALRLEHATIPPYLYSYFSLDDQKNKEVAKIIRTVFVEEMLHMLLVANVMNALGGNPRLDARDLLPVYPGPLPESVVGGLEVGLEPCSLQQIEKMFMGIEEPETKLNIEALDLEEFVTIGQFYKRIISAAEELPASAWHSPARNQINRMTGIVVVTDLASAKKALRTIIEQGEGTETDPLLTSKGPAHYYRFKQIPKGRFLVESGKPGDPPEDRWSFTGPPITLESSGVYPVPTNPKTATYEEHDSKALEACRRFNRAYTEMLGTLEKMMNGEPDLFKKTIEQMNGLWVLGRAMASGRSEAAPGKNVGPSFEYEPATP